MIAKICPWGLFKMLELIEQWLDFKNLNQGKSEATIVKYRYYLTLFIEYCDIKKINALNATTTELEYFLGFYLHERKLSPQTRRTGVAAIRGFYAWLTEQTKIKVNTAIDLPYPASAKKIPVAMGLANFEKLLHQCDLSTFLGIRDAAIIAILGGTGMRLGGLYTLNQSSLQFFEHEDRERLAIKVLEKGNKERLLPVPLEAHLFLRAYLGHPELKAINRDLPNGDKVLFVSTNNHNINTWDYYGENRRLQPRSIQDMITKRGESAGIPRNQSRPHALRHLTGTEYAEEDLDLITIQTLLGHVSPNTTAIYIHMAMRKLTSQIDKANPLAKVKTAVTPLINRPLK
jgi:integrase/recombinase XerD